jgi:predicted membrane-bound dolichyl-phosphate-mannose-protein mannosyltransferase
MVTALAMLRTSTTFDEIVMVAAGARGFATGHWDLAPEHPPLTQYLYGLPAYLSGPRYPDEAGIRPLAQRTIGDRYVYAQRFFFRAGNRPELLAFVGRLPAVLCGVAMILLTCAFVRRAAGERAAVLAAAMTALLPDLLAHGGVAYNDLPVALALLAALWKADEVLRRPEWRAAAAAGVLAGVALATKNSASAIVPAIALLAIFESAGRWRSDRAWRRGLIPATLAWALGAYLTLVAVYRGDFLLTEYRYSLGFVFRHVGTDAPAYL